MTTKKGIICTIITPYNEWSLRLELWGEDKGFNVAAKPVNYDYVRRDVSRLAICMKDVHVLAYDWVLTSKNDFEEREKAFKT